MGQALASCAARAASADASPRGESSQQLAEEDAALARLAGRPPLRCVFYHEGRALTAALTMPLVFDPPPPHGTRLSQLEMRLRESFGVPSGSSVFAVVPADEPYAPPFPLVLLNVLATRMAERLGPDEPMPEVHLALVVHSLALVRQSLPRGDAEDSPFFTVSAQALAQPDASDARRLARMRFVANMQRYGFARLEVTREQAQLPADAFRTVRQWLVEQLALPPTERWVDFVDARDRQRGDAGDGQGDNDQQGGGSDPYDAYPTVSRGRRVGFSSDRNREYLQLRLPLAASGTVWPSQYFVDAGPDAVKFAQDMLALMELLDDVARDCMRAICEVLGLDEEWVIGELLDDRTPPPTSEDEVVTKDKSKQYGASVLRVYNYRNKANAPPDDNSCGVHADLGLVTVSPVATVPGLQMWNLERMLWADVEEDATALHFSVFAGETLGVLTNGGITAPLHRVPGIVVDSEEERRMSMPYFLRVRPEKCLNPEAPPEMHTSCRDFMEDNIFKKRPWRREDKSGTPDY